MAQRRMFSKSITNSSQFLMMPQSSQNLYFHLGMNADDDGFCEHFTIMRMTESKPDDLKILQAKGFVQIFDDKVLIIIQWKENNYLRSDRYTPSKYLEIYKEELKCLPHGIPKDIPMDDTGKVSIGKVRKDKESKEKIIKESPYTPEQTKTHNDLKTLFWDDYQIIYNNKMDLNKKEIGCLQQLVLKYPNDDIKVKYQVLKEQVENSKNTFYCLLPSMLLSQWNRLVVIDQDTPIDLDAMRKKYNY